MSDSSIQHTQLMLGAAMLIAALGTLLLSLAGRWIGSAWTTLLAVLLTYVVAYQPLIGAPLFAGLKTDILRRIIVTAIPFALILIALSFKRVPLIARLLFTILGPSLMLWFVFANYPMDRSALLLHRVVPIGIVILIAWMLIEPIAVRSPGTAVPLVIGCFTGPAAFVLLNSTQQQAGEMAPLIPATAAGALLAAMLASLFTRPLNFARGPILLWLTLTGSMYAFLWIDGDLPLNHLYWIATIPLLAWIAEIPPIHRLKPWKRELIRFAIMLTPAIIVFVRVYKEMQQVEM